jgi:hypothetical protein
MTEYIKEYWKMLSIAGFFLGLLVYFGISEKPKKVEEEKSTVKVVTKPKTDSIIQVIDSVLEMKKELEIKKEIAYKKKESLLRKQLELEKSKPVKIKEKTKVVVQTKEVIVEKKVPVVDPNTKKIVEENYKIQEENKYLKQEIECIKSTYENKTTYQVRKDSISTDTIRRKKRRFGIF